MKTIYICAPYRSNNKEGIKKNIEFAEECARFFMSKGYAPIIIQSLVKSIFGFETNNENADKIITEYCDSILRKCDMMCICGPHISKGMKHEIDICIKEGIPMVSLVKDNNRWAFYHRKG